MGRPQAFSIEQRAEIAKQVDERVRVLDEVAKIRKALLEQKARARREGIELREQLRQALRKAKAVPSFRDLAKAHDVSAPTISLIRSAALPPT